jgi:hypothetical protein
MNWPCCAFKQHGSRLATNKKSGALLFAEEQTIFGPGLIVRD